MIDYKAKPYISLLNKKGMGSFWKVVNSVIDEADVLLEVLDARFPEETRNKEIEYKIERKDKRLIYILNKADLLKEKFSDIKINFNPYIFISAKDNLGTTKLRLLLKQLAKEKKPLLVGILGYPNTGKSSLINTLKQKKAALTSSTPGFTRGMQKIRISRDIYLIDTPGVFSYKEKDEEKQTLTNVKDHSKVKNPDLIALDILEKAYLKNPKIIQDIYQVNPVEDAEETLHLIAKRFNWIIKKGKPNLDLTSRKIIQDWQRGKLII